MNKFILLLIIAYKITYQSCPILPVQLSKNDFINKVEDEEFGIGDDDLFNANDFFLLHKGETVKNLRDYNLSTSFKSLTFNSLNGDTISAEISFPGLKTNDTLILIERINFFNGDRSSLKNWTKSIKVKDLEISYNNNCIGKATLFNSYKMQSIYLKKSIPIIGNKKHYIHLIVKSLYSKSKGGYSISEIGFDGIKKY